MMPWRKQFGLTRKRLFAWLMTLAVVCIWLPRGVTDRADDLCAVVLAPLSMPARDLSLAVTRRVAENAPSHVSTRDHQELLQRYRLSQRQLLNVSRELAEQRELNVQLAQVRQRFGMARAACIDATVLAADTSSRWRRLTLNQGSLDHIQSGQLVLACEKSWQQEQGAPDIYRFSVVGRICQVGMWTSTLQLVSDGEFVLPVTVAPHVARAATWEGRGFLRGGGMDPSRVTMIKRELPVQVGDAVYARVEADILPTPMLIGTVSQVRPDDRNPVMWEIVLASATPLDSLRRVLVVDASNRTRQEP